MRKRNKEQMKQILALWKQISRMLAEKTDMLNNSMEICDKNIQGRSIHIDIKNCHMENKWIQIRNEVMELLLECQNAAITVGTQIEKKESNTATQRAVSSLENYCEKLYQFSQFMSRDALVQMDEALDDAAAAIEAILVKKIICFLPYKASMWDSLESVWKAADEDPACEAYVIPIPYFDRKADGTFGELHDEGELYPKYVPITSYQDFDLEEIKPDKIFIHNPYDECNRVTSVHPAFYSSKLKAYTEELIYIPYFVLHEINPEDENAVEHMAHFCKVPAVLHAHKVIVQSEPMKQVYVKVLTEWMGEDTKSRWEEKILGLGSPKLDKAGNIQKEELEIPNEWMQMIEKTDETWKKVVFYNTSITAFLEHGEKMLEKMENVFQVFEECKDEVTLLWRPHPLLITTMESMRPELLERYQGIVKRYKEKQIGIYDDTSDLNRAIGLADAYFGDPSSVVQLCQRAGMPVMIQDVEINYE